MMVRRVLLGMVWVAAAIVPAAGDAGADGDEALWAFGWITDTQSADCRRIGTLVAEVRENGPRMLLHTGDTRFEWANQCAWREVMKLVRSADPPVEMHLAPGNHDLEGGRLKNHLRLAAVEGTCRLDTGRTASGQGYYHNRVTEWASGEGWPAWNPEVAGLGAWQPGTAAATNAGPRPAYRYVFRRGGIRFVVCDYYPTAEQRDWIRRVITDPDDDSSVTILLHHRHEVDVLARYFEGLEGRHNVRLVLSGDHHIFGIEERHGVTFITGAGMARGAAGECDAMTMRVYADRLQLDRHVVAAGEPLGPISPPETIWTCAGQFSAWSAPEPGSVPPVEMTTAGAIAAGEPPLPTTMGADLLVNGGFENGLWYERFRGWAPSGWYQWFVPPHAPEHVAETSRPSGGTHYVRAHMWALAWHGGILQTVRDVEPGHWYRLEGYGFFAPPNAPNPRCRIGIDPCGTLTEQFNVDVSAHPAPSYDEAIGDNPRTPETEGPGLPDTIAWSPEESYYDWGRFVVDAEARAETIQVYLESNPDQRPATRPIYEMNWDSFSLREIAWPTRRLVAAATQVTADPGVTDVQVRVHPGADAAEATWRTDRPGGAVQALYRYLGPTDAASPAGEPVDTGVFPFQTEVAYENGTVLHRARIAPLNPPAATVAMETVVLTRVIDDAGEAVTIASAPVVTAWQ